MEESPQGDFVPLLARLQPVGLEFASSIIPVSMPLPGRPAGGRYPHGGRFTSRRQNHGAEILHSVQDD